MSNLDLLKAELFGNKDTAIFDIKFYMGEDPDSSIEDIAGSILAGVSDFRAGKGRDIDLSN